MSAPAFTALTRETIEGATGPAPSYRGMIAAMETFNGCQIIVMAADINDLLTVMKEINPNVTPDRTLCMPASVIHDRYVKRKDNDL